MEVIAALRIPKGTPLLAVVALVDASSTASIRFWFVAEGTIVAELIRAILPADRTDTIVAIAAEGVAQSSILLLISRAGRDRLADTTSLSLEPAGLHVRVARYHLLS